MHSALIHAPVGRMLAAPIPTGSVERGDAAILAVVAPTDYRVFADGCFAMARNLREMEGLPRLRGGCR